MKRKNFLKTLALLPFAAYNMKIQDFPKIVESLPGTEKMPALFVGHGSPMNALEDNAFTKSLKALGKQFKEEGKKPAAILVVSAHWLTRGSYVNIQPKPETIHDFGGFPQELFDAQYPAPGAPEQARETAALSPLIQETEEWGLDHGSWTILMHLFPEADVPVFQLSIDYNRPMEYHFSLAQQLASLREKGVLIIGSGNIVHNLRLSMGKLRAGDTQPYDWALEFDKWVLDKINDRDFNALQAYQSAGEAGKLSVPTVDHYVPMLYSLGLAGEKEEIAQAYEEVTYGGISMRTFQIG
ncbi:MAG: 4,5-DOPA dioxygenase extradiol [Saprospiraceae bacterium]|nr:4,5-DOPA dioxygenase extradiol [Saprospiraceae bacterium]